MWKPTRVSFTLSDPGSSFFPMRLFTSGTSGSVFASMSSGHLFAWGCNDQGQLGVGFTRHVWHPIPVNGVVGRPGVYVSNVATSRYHTLVLTEDGRVFSFGANLNGELGIGSRSPSVSDPKLIEDFSHPCVSVAVGLHHSAVCTSNGDLFTFGSNERGQLGQGTKFPTGILVPSRVGGGASELGALRVYPVKCGTAQTFVLDDCGVVHAFGENAQGQLGLGHTRNVNIPTPVVSLNANEGFVVDIEVGTDHAMACMRDGRVFAWGKNRNGEVGDGSFDDRAVPCEMGGDSLSEMLREKRASVRLSRRVLQFCAGGRITNVKLKENFASLSHWNVVLAILASPSGGSTCKQANLGKARSRAA